MSVVPDVDRLHPLFVDGLPEDFKTNSILLALSAPLPTISHGDKASRGTAQRNCATTRGRGGPAKYSQDDRKARLRLAAPFLRRRGIEAADIAEDQAVSELSVFFKLWKPTQ